LALKEKSKIRKWKTLSPCKDRGREKGKEVKEESTNGKDESVSGSPKKEKKKKLK